MKTIWRSMKFDWSASDVFTVLDDLAVTGSHMTKSSMMLMGSNLRLEFLTAHKTGLGSRYRWSGKMMGMPVDFSVEVTKWTEGKEKVWETVGDAKLILYSWYRMTLNVFRLKEGSSATLSISYQRPHGYWNNILSFLFARLYGIWCLNKMLDDSRKFLSRSGLHAKAHAI